MTELISGFLCSDLKSKSTGEGYDLSFNPGRLTAALLLASAAAAITLFA